MDLEISSDNKIFASTTHDAIFGVNSLSSLGGGRIYRSDDSGNSFEIIHEIRFDYTTSVVLQIHIPQVELRSNLLLMIS